VSLELAGEIDSAAAFFRYADQLLGRERFAAAGTLFRRTVARNPARRLARFSIGMCLLAQKRPGEALSWFGEEWELDPDGPAALGVGMALVELDREEEALEWLGRAVTRVPDSRSHEVHYYRGLAREGLSDPDGAMEEYRKALRRNPEHEPSRAALARLSLGLN
jgi:tetratricopeptide (TPR) repeat protein